MSEDSVESSANKVVEIIVAHQKTTQAALLNEIKEKLEVKNTNSIVQEPTLEITKFEQIIFNKVTFTLIVLIIGLSALYCAKYFPSNVYSALTRTDYDPKTLLALLGFIVALSSYLASVIRAIIDKLTEKNKLKARKSIFIIAVVEVSLVILSLVVIFRFLKGSVEIPLFNFPKRIFETVNIDSFILTYLAIILICMAGLHFKVWGRNKSYMIIKHGEKFTIVEAKSR